MIGIHFELCYDRSCSAYLPIPFGEETVYMILSTCFRICDMVRSLVSIPHLLLEYVQSSGAPERPGQISSWLSLHNCQSHSAMNIVDTIIEFWCHNLRPGLTYWWQHCSWCSNIIVVRTYLRSAFIGVVFWDTARVFMVMLHLSLLSMSWPKVWPMIEVQTQLRSAIQSRMTFLDFNEVNFGKLQLIVTVSFQVGHTSTATICLRSARPPLHSALYILVYFFLIMFSSALNRWTLCTQIVISQTTAHLGAGGSSR